MYRPYRRPRRSIFLRLFFLLLYILFMLGTFALAIGVPIGLVYIVIHFAMKYW